MSLSTLLEAAKYLDYLDSNNQNQEQQNNQQQQQQHYQQHQLLFQQNHHHHHHQSSQPEPTNNNAKHNKSSTPRRQRFTKKNAANTMLAMSLPASTGTMQQMHSMPIPLSTSSGGSHQGTSLSSSLTTGSPLSSFASTALFCSKASSSAASSLSSSDSSSSCGEILMGDSDFNPSITNNNQMMVSSSINNDHLDYHLTARKQQQQQPGDSKPHIQFIATNNSDFLSTSVGANSGAGPSSHSVARFLAATSSGPQLVTMSTSSTSMVSNSAPVDANIRAGHIIHAANAGATLINSGNSGATVGVSPPNLHQPSFVSNLNHRHEATYNIAHTSFASDNNSNSSPTNRQQNRPPVIMARVQPMILNSLSAHSIMAFQPAAASSPTSSSSSYSRHRELHKTLEKNRRAHLRHCFELLKSELPASECVDKKTSHINIIRSAIRYVLALRQQEVEFENELHRLTKIKNELTENLSKMNSNQPEQLNATTSSSTIAGSTSSPVSSSQQVDIKIEQQQHPVPEQQLSFLLSQSKLD